MTLDEYCDWLKRFDPAKYEIWYMWDEPQSVFMNQDIKTLSPNSFMSGELEIREKATPPEQGIYEGKRVYVFDTSRAGMGKLAFEEIGTLKGDRVMSDE